MSKPKNKAVTQYNAGGIYDLYRQLVPFINPEQVIDGNTWRKIARSQPIIMDCITSLSMYIQGLPYDIQARDSEQSEKLDEEIQRHKDILNESQDGSGFLTLIDYLVQDFYTIPFGAGIETVRFSDGRLYSIRALDGATLYPYNDEKYPVIQYVPELAKDAITFKPDELVRMYQSPRPELQRRGWQVAQPERIYLALELLNRGDKYYASLLTDTPEAGILDLGDMSADSANKWLDSARSLFAGIDPFKIPVLYEHNIQAKYIPFNRPPTDLQFDAITMKYAQIAVSSFGITLSDIGLTQSNGSLSSNIREDRHSRGTGKAFIKRHIERMFNSILPKELKFFFVDTDDELMVSKGRARSANGVAFRNLIESGILTPDQARQQLKADGLITIPLPAEVDPEDFDILKDISGLNDQLELQKQQINLQKQQAAANGGSKVARKGGQAGFSLNKRRNVRGGKLESVQGKDNVPASQGGQGEVKSMVENSLADSISQSFGEIYSKIDKSRFRKIIKFTLPKIDTTIKSSIDPIWRANYESELFDNPSNFEDRELIQKSIKTLSETLKSEYEKDKWWMIYLPVDEISDYLAEYYANGLKDAANEIQRSLYENNLSETIDVNSVFELKNLNKYNTLVDRTNYLEKSINEGTLYYLTRLSIKSILDSLEEYQNEYIDNTDIVNQDDFINRASDILENGFLQLLNERSTRITDYEINRAYQLGVLDQYEKVGIDKKYVVHIGSDEPCEECTININRSEVPLNETFESKFKDTYVQAPPFHLDCHCILKFSTDNLDKITTDYYLGD